MNEIVVDAVRENLTRVTEFINALLREYDCPERAMFQIDLAVDEIFTNISDYAYQNRIGTATVQVEILKEPLGAAITFLDNGTPYNPLLKDDPDITSSAEKRPIGGLGIYLVKKTMDCVTYEYKDGKNILTVTKSIV